ncbi:hypothetical protein D910_02971 [Dendroctonus ponderosae]|uniref:Uncharacterized protein n=1 Tax=Dendroctonus ponderosae TaxID=77166 RepID=U4TXL8_DENPD|nr:hypothetical protein D910_02971 [Dendroctonus ponderosae]
MSILPQYKVDLDTTAPRPSCGVCASATTVQVNGSPVWAPFTVKYDTDKREVSHLFWRFLELSGIPGESYISDDENQTGKGSDRSDRLQKKASKFEWTKHTPSDLKRPLSSDLKCNTKTKRSVRRPKSTVTTLTSSHVAEKYSQLLDKRDLLLDKQLEVADLQIRQEKIKCDLLEIELANKKEKY